MALKVLYNPVEQCLRNGINSRLKSDNFGHKVTSYIHLRVETQMRRIDVRQAFGRRATVCFFILLTGWYGYVRYNYLKRWFF